MVSGGVAGLEDRAEQFLDFRGALAFFGVRAWAPTRGAPTRDGRGEGNVNGPQMDQAEALPDSQAWRRARAR